MEKPIKPIKLFESYDLQSPPAQRVSDASEPLATNDRHVLVQGNQHSKLVKGMHIVLFFLSLYLFMVSIRWLSDGFTLLVACQAKSVFDFSNNSICSLMIGVVAAALLHSQSTVVSITVASVGAGALSLRQAIPIVMGANLGTCVTCILVAFAQVHSRDQFERAMAAATVHDMYNLWSIVVLYPIEVVLHPLEKLGSAMTRGSGKIAFSSPLDKIIDPFADHLVSLNRTIVQNIVAASGNGTTCNETKIMLHGSMRNSSMTTAGTVTLVVGFICLILALVGMVYTMTRLFRNTTSSLLQRVLNFNAYVNILIGLIITMILHSSTAMTSTLTPLAGLNVITMDQLYPLILGSNIGTTASGLLAAVVTGRKEAGQVALANIWFNVFGILLFYVVPATRYPVVHCAQRIGKYSAQWPMVAIIFLLVTFALLPGILIALAFIYDAGAGGIVIGVLLTFGLISAICSLYFWYYFRSGRLRWHTYLNWKALQHEQRCMDVYLEDEF
ncbi:sodium-dependent phosphate transporter [Thraustotheca clavata]|uniref:Sodium-dependent phosphate transporter n=1 Tax=Thraustotheca clavata TaxID=74557 RepID=A0A1W0A736_9STRA|nr:sodium-dependent phosphate transporter [Thraustotheca clavata]